MGMSSMLGKPQLGKSVTGERGGCSRALTSGREDSHPVMTQGSFCDRTEAQQAISLRDVEWDPPLAGPSSQMGRAKRQQRPGSPRDIGQGRVENGSRGAMNANQHNSVASALSRAV